MKTAGKLWYTKGIWAIQAPPHIMLRLKQVFQRVEKGQFGTVTLKDTPEICNDLEWFLQRYPLEVADPKRLALSARLHRTQLEALEETSHADYVPTPRALRYPLRDYQARMVDIFLQRGYLLCADVVGLGKTVEALGALTDKRLLPALVVCKSHLQEQWCQSVLRFLVDADHPAMSASVEIIGTTKIYQFTDRVPDVLIISYSKLFAWCEELAPLVKSLIFDEVQELRRTESRKSQAAAFLRPHVKFCLGLSATPIYNYGGEFFSIMNLIAPWAIGAPGEFYREWCDGHGPKALIRDPDAFGTYLREQFLMIRRTRKEVSRELPPVLTIVERVDYDTKIMDSIKDPALALAKMVLKGTFKESGMAARELDNKVRHATGVSKAPFVITFVRMLLDEGPVVLCGWHREVYEIWKLELEKWNIPYAFYTGSETAKEKNTAKKRFCDGEAKVLILSLRSGEGLDGLQEVSNTIVFGELDWSPGIHEQCRGRLFRDGQQKSVSEFYMVSNGGSDPLVAEILGLKRAQVAGIVDPGSKGLKKLQSDAQRIKRLAQYYIDTQFGGKNEDEPDHEEGSQPMVGDSDYTAYKLRAERETAPAGSNPT